MHVCCDGFCVKGKNVVTCWHASSWVRCFVFAVSQVHSFAGLSIYPRLESESYSHHQNGMGRCHGEGGGSADVSAISVHPDVIYVVTCNDKIGCSTLSHRHGGTPAKETITHYLFECPAYHNEQHDLDRALGRHSRDLESIMASKKCTRELLRFIGRTKRLKKPFGDVTQHLDEGI